jgi:MarR-like DNA-binding transcriptional regulator SgrR of sgrS sRNA
MVNRPTSAIYSIVEKAYFRLQAGDVLTHCMEDGSTMPIHEMIQEMVLAGPQSLDALREILGEAMKRKTQVYDDLNQVTNQLSIILKGYGINLEPQGGKQVLQTMNEKQLLDLMDGQAIVEKEARSGCLQVLKDSQELITTLNGKIQLLANIETYLQDWLWGLTYQFIRQGEAEAGNNVIKGELL